MPPTDPEVSPRAARPKSWPPAVAALGWALACAACAAALWLSLFTLLTVGSVPDLPGWYLKLRLPSSGTVIATVAGLGGLVSALCIGLRRGVSKYGPQTLALASGVAIIGATAGALTLPVAVACLQWLPPFVSYALVWTVAGFLAGLGGFSVSRWKPNTEGEEPPEEEPPPGAKVEWLLHEPKRPWRDRALVRVCPALAVSVATLIGAAAFAPSELSLALLAIGVLGLSVAFVLYMQELRLDRLEQRSRETRDS